MAPEAAAILEQEPLQIDPSLRLGSVCEDPCSSSPKSSCFT